MDTFPKMGTPENGDRVTMRRGRGEVVKVIIRDYFWPEGDPRTDALAIEAWKERGWRVTRVEKAYAPEDDSRAGDVDV